MRKLRVPVAIAFVLVGCGDDGGGECAMTREPCVQAPNDPEPCPENVCVDTNNSCPAHCIPAGSKFYCIPDNTDAGCPTPTVCIVAGQQCPSGCTPVG